MAQNQISMPGVFGGLMRFDEEFKSRFMISPAHVIVYIILIILFGFSRPLAFESNTNFFGEYNFALRNVGNYEQ